MTNILVISSFVMLEFEWDEALDFVARRLGEIRDANGADSIGALSSKKRMYSFWRSV